MEKEILTETAYRRVIVFPALTTGYQGKRVHFLLSVLKVADILQEELLVQTVPLSPPFLEGISEWRDRVLPVISLEQCLGLKVKRIQQSLRSIVVRIAEAEAGHVNSLHGVLKVAPNIEMLSLPIQCTPVSHEWIPREHLIRGVYEWNRGFLVVVHMENILRGENLAEAEMTALL